VASRLAIFLALEHPSQGPAGGSRAVRRAVAGQADAPIAVCRSRQDDENSRLRSAASTKIPSIMKEEAFHWIFLAETPERPLLNLASRPIYSRLLPDKTN
jgi:hypothetical protein